VSALQTYELRLQGHRSVQTIKQVTFYGPRSEYVISGSDDGLCGPEETAPPPRWTHLF